MSYLYVTEQGSVVSYKDHRFHVKYKDGMLHSIPAEPLEVIEIFGNIQLTTQCMRECLLRGISVIFYSIHGAYFGRLTSSNHVNVARQRRQFKVSENQELKLEFSKKIIKAKINNQIVILQRYTKHNRNLVKSEIDMMKIMIGKIDKSCKSLEQLIGYEGYAAKSYFQGLGKIVIPEFTFTKRSRRPPLDAFNSMLSLGYSIMMNEIFGKIEAKGLNPYLGMLHKDREKHPTLASDLMEEWRAVLIDSLTLSLVNGKEISKDGFYQDIDQGPGVFLDHGIFNKYVKKLEGKFKTENKYLDYVDNKVSFRRALDLQVNQFVKMIDTEDISEYHPVKIR